MKTNTELRKILELLSSSDIESKQLGMSLFRKSEFIRQFRGQLPCLGFLLFEYSGSKCLRYISYRDLCKRLPSNPEYLFSFINNNYKAFLIIKNNRLW